MKKTKLFALMLSVVVALGVLSSCNTGGSSDYVTRQVLSGFTNVTTDYTTGDKAITTGIGYVVEINYTKGTADVTIEGLKLPNGKSFGQLILYSLPVSMSTDGWIEIKPGAMVTPTTSAGLQAPTFTSFTFRICDRMFSNDLYYPLFDIRYSVDSYNLVSVPQTLINVGTTLVASEGQPNYSPSESEEPLYGIILNTTNMTATIQIQGAKFASAMPALNMAFTNIPFTFEDNGYVSLKSESLEPSIITGTNSTTPMPNYPITNLTCHADGQNNMTLGFTCTIKSERDGQATETAYNVSVVCQTPKATN